jgi:6,7-dimethyl-8-ribityllumazine synthase
MGRYDGIEELDPDTNGAGDGLLSSCTAGLVKHGVAQKDMRIVSVPGALEIPLTLKKMAQSGKYDALIALGAVIRGETYHFEIVSNESSRGITEVQLATGVPIANGILTTEDDDQAEVRMAQKGLDCALAAIEMARLLPRL